MESDNLKINKMYYILRGKGICLKLMSPGPNNDFEDILKIKDFICCYLGKTTQTTRFQVPRTPYLKNTTKNGLELKHQKRNINKKYLKIWIISEIFIWSFPNCLMVETKFLHVY